ncbi:MAG TPA: septum formation initiator, partial [Cytophagales bacterium]|nr:septum formation initiator [Cytophagales bacterium]
MLKRVPSLFKNFYFSAGLFFIVWLAFFDSNDLVSRFRMSRKLNQLASEKEYYQEK